MGQFDIYRTTKSLPGAGPNVTGNINFDTGAAAIGRGIQQIGGAISTIAMQTWEIQADKEFSQMTLEARRRINEFSVFMETSRDETVITEKKTELLGTLQEMEIKNGLAARKYQMWLDEATPTIEEGIQRKLLQIERDDWQAVGINLQAEAIRTGNLSAVAPYYANGVKKGMITAEENAKIMQTTRHEASLRAAQEYAWRFPDEVINRLKEEGTLDEFPDLTDPDDWGRIRNYAVMRKNDLGIQSDKARLAENTQLWNLLKTEGASSENVLKLIDSMQTYTPDEKQTLFKSSLETFKAIQAGRGNPLIIRQDGAKYWELYQKAVDGKATEKDFRQAVNDLQITVNDYKELTNVVEGLTPKSAVEETTQAMKSLDNYLNAIPTTHYEKTALETARIKARRCLEDAIKEAKEAGTPLTGAELDRQMIRIARIAEREIEELGEAELIYPTPELNTEALHKEIDIIPDKLDILSNQAEVDAFKGTYFKTPDGKIYKKER